MSRRSRLKEASPFEVVLLTASVLSGLVVIIGTEVPPSLAGTLPPWAQVLWSVGLTVGGVMALIGLSLKAPVDARLLELSGLSLVAATVLTYVTALAAVQGQAAVVTGSLGGAYGCACAWRVLQLWLAVRTVVRDVQER